MNRETMSMSVILVKQEEMILMIVKNRSIQYIKKEKNEIIIIRTLVYSFLLLALYYLILL